MAKNKIIRLKCPTCKKETVYSEENSSRPFCSEKCRLIDLGQWFEEDYKFESCDTVSRDDDCE